ncbi:MAG: hypothetical protein KAW87_08610, partial [Candidatus Cloacimonetes bacterium]|nr:hypothetical protein [Candidatus Cloacimonadota bacterium]
NDDFKKTITVSFGGGIAKAGDEFKSHTVHSLKTIMSVLYEMINNCEIEKVIVLLPFGLSQDIIPYAHPKITIHNKQEELVDLFASTELIITKGGRNTISEILFYRKKGIIIPTIQDHRRGEEQLSNSKYAERYPNIRVIYSNTNKLDVLDLKQKIQELLTLTEFPTYRFISGNEKIVHIITELISV